MSHWEALEERVAGKWQIPLLGLSLIMLAASLDNLCVHRLDDTGVTGLALNHPKIS